MKVRCSVMSRKEKRNNQKIRMKAESVGLQGYILSNIKASLHVVHPRIYTMQN